MKTVKLDEAREHLDDLLESARPGESIEIVREGVKIAELLKASDGAPADATGPPVAPVSMRTQAEREAVLAGIRIRSGLRGLTIKELRDEGRR